MKNAVPNAPVTFRKMKWTRNDLEQLEERRHLAVDTIQPLPFRLDFNQNIANTIVDKDGQGIGLTRLQANKFGTEYQQNLIDIDVNAGVLKLTTTGTSAAGSNAGSDNTQANALETQFDGTTSGFVITARLLGDGNGVGLNYLNDSYEQAGIYFGPDQDNFIKLVAIRSDAGQVLQFKSEIGGSSALADSLTRISIGSFAAINTLDVRIVGDAATGKVQAYYSVNGATFQKMALEYTIPAGNQSAFFNSTSRAGLLTSHKNNVGPITATFDSFEILAGESLANRPSVSGTRPANGESNVSRDVFVAADVVLPTSGAGIDSSTLNGSTVRLYRQSDSQSVLGVINTSGGGDAIVFTPTTPLAANTTYVFEVTNGAKDTQGKSFIPYTSTFTTGTQGATVDTSVSFTKTSQAASQGKRHTSLVFGPDGKLYTTTIDGKIIRYNVASDGTLGNATEILTIQNREGGRRSATSIIFDPASTAGNLIAYVSHSDFAGLELKEYVAENLGAATQWSGKITKLTGSSLQNGQDLVTGLPRSVRDHQNYQMSFGPDGKLYISQSSMSAMGAPDNAWGNKAEVLLSASILQVDVAAIGAGTVNVRTEGLGANNYNPFAANAPVKIYATGLRSAFDVLWHSNGSLYSATNGSAAGGNTPGGGGVAALTNVATQNDYLFRVQSGKYYGHPNPLRGEYVLNGGNPTAGTDPGEVSQYTVGTQPDSNWGGFIYNYGKNYSPNGMIEYSGSAFGGALNKSIIGVRYSGGDDLIVLDVAANGGISAVHTNYVGLNGFVNPLDVVQNPNNGDLYVIEFGDQAAVPGTQARITLLSANTGTTPAGVGQATLSRGKVYLSDQTNTSAASKAQNVRLTNTGNGVLTLTGLSITGTNASEFSVRDAFGNVINTPITLNPNERVDLYITFKATTTGIRSATLNVTTSQGVSQVTLRAVGMSGTGGSLEPSLQRIFDLYQIGVNVGDNDPATTDFPVDTATSVDEVIAPRLVKASTGPVTVEVLGVFANQVSKTTFGWYEAGNNQTKNPLAQVDAVDNQSIAPLADGQFTFDPGSQAFGIYSNFTLGSTTNPLNRDVFSENVLNTWETNASRQKKVRFYQLKDANGVVTPNAYVVAFEEYNLSFDQNDLVAIIRNVQPAAAGAEIGVENRDNVPAADFLVMSRISPNGVNAFLPNEFHDRSTLRVRNTGNQNLDISSITISNTDFVIDSGGGARTLTPGAFVDVVVRFVYERTTKGNVVRTATLTINSNDADEAAKQVKLSGLWQSHSEDAPTGGSQEPTLQRTIDAFGYAINTGTVNTAGNATRAGDEILSELWQRADAGLPVGVQQLAAYHQQYNVDYSTKSQINWYNPTNINSGTGKPNSTKIFAHAQIDSQSLLPRLDNSTTQLAAATFNPNSVSQFGFKVDGYYSTDVFNTPNDKNNPGHGIRFYQVRDKNGQIVPNTYILAQDYSGVSYANFDYQDNIYLLTNVKPVSAPLAPAGLAATGSGSGISLNWTDSTEGNVTGYRVYRATSAGGVYSMIAETIASDYNDTAAPGNATSYYKVAAITYQSQESAQSSTASAFRSGTGGTLPTAPTAASATANAANSVTVNWTDASNNETGFRIERKTGAGAFQPVGNVSANVATYTDNTVSASTSYTYRVIAINASGDSSASNDANVTTPAAQPGVVVLTSTDIGNPTPSGSVTTVTPGSDYNVNVGGLDIWGTYDSFNFLQEQRTGNFDVSVRIAGLTAVDNDTMAGLMVRETLATGSKHVNIKVRPSGFRLNWRASTNGTTSASGTGTANTSNAYVRIQRVGNTFNTFTSTDGVNWTAFQTVTVSMNSTVYVGLATSAKSNSQATTALYRGYGDTGSQTQPVAPAAPSNLVATAYSQTNVGLAWTDNANSETGYRVERKTGTGAWQLLTNLGANASSYTDATATAGTTYSYRVFATAAVDSAASNTASVTTPGNPSSGSTLNSVADAYVLGGSPTTNYGSDASINVKVASTSTTRMGYVRFNLASLAGQNLNTITLRLYGQAHSTGGSLDVEVFGAEDAWNENSINYNNRPNLTTGALGSINVSTANWHEINVSNYVKAALANGQTSITFALAGVSTTSAYAVFNSRESGSNGPELAYTVNGAQPQVPAAASGLNATANSQTSIGLTWTDNASIEIGFRIERKIGNGSYATLTTVGANVTTYTDNTAAASTNYTYRVIAYNATGDATTASNESSVTTPANQSSGTTLNSVADAYVLGGSPTTNYGSDNSINVKVASTSTTRLGYVRFNLASLAGQNLNTVTLRLYGQAHSNGGSLDVEVFGAQDTWNENSVNYNNRPATTTAALGSVNVTTPAWHEIDVTSYVNSAIANGQTSITFALAGVSTTSAYAVFSSRESGSNGPQLVTT